MHVNLPQNSASESQREILDALPALVFLEQAGRIVYANAEARKLLGLEDGESLQRPIEDVLWGLFPSTAETQAGLQTGPQAEPGERRRGRAFHATVLARNGRMLPVEGTYCALGLRAVPSGRHRCLCRRARTCAALTTHGRRAGQHSRSRGHRPPGSPALYQSGIHQNVPASPAGRG